MEGSSSELVGRFELQGRVEITLSSLFRYNQSLDSVHKTLDEHSRKLNAIQLNLDKMAFAPKQMAAGNVSPFQWRSVNATALFYILFGLLVHTLFMWLFLYKK